MKRKGIPFVEQHAEKIFIALLAVAFLGVLSLQFLTTPNAVTVDGKEVPPSGVFRELASEAERLQGEVNDSDPRLPEVETPELVGPLEDSIETPDLVAGEPSPRVAWTPPVRLALAEDAVLDTAPIKPLRVPAPTNAIAANQWGTLDPYFVDAYPEAREIIPREEQPFDTPSVSIEAAFSGTALLEALRSGGEESRSIPERWWRGRKEIVGIEVQRQAREPGKTAWSSAEVLGRPFWVPSVLETAFAAQEEPIGAEDLSPGDIPSVLSVVRENPGLAMRHPFMQTIAGPVWRPPHRSEDVGADLARLEEIDRLRSRIESVEGRLSALTEAQTEDRDRVEAQRERIEEQLSDLESQLATLEDEELGLPAEGDEGEEAETAPLLESASLRVWTHDARVEPGVEYRYRVRVSVTNPLFGRERSLGTDDEAVLAEAKRPFSTSGWSEWSAPITVDRAEFYCLTAASERGELRAASVTATAEVFRMFYGYYRQETLTLAPGAPVAGSIDVPEDAPLFTFDIEQADPVAIEDFLAALTPEEERRARPQRRRPRDPGTRPGGGGGRDPGRDPRRERRPDPDADPDEPLEPPAGVRPLPAETDFMLEAVLLDVATRPDRVNGEAFKDVFLVDQQLGVLRRSPQTDRERESYQRMQLSARRGQGARIRAPRPVEGP